MRKKAARQITSQGEPMKLLKVKGSGAEARAGGPFLQWQNCSGEAAKSAERERERERQRDRETERQRDRETGRERSPKAIKRDLRALGRPVEASGAQVVFSSIPSVAVNSTERGRKTHLVNRWLRDWCHRSNFGFFVQGEVYTAPGLLATGGTQLSQRGKRILGHELAGLIVRALN